MTVSSSNNEKPGFKLRRRRPWLWKILIPLALLIAVRCFQTLTASVDRADAPPVIRSGPCEIVKVIDATTFLIRQSSPDQDSVAVDSVIIRVRLMTIEIPEHRGNAEYVAQQALRFTEGFLADQSPTIRLDRRRVDRDGVGLVFLYAGEQCLNLELAKSGWGLVKIHPGDAERIEKQLREAEEDARLNRRGVWSD